MNERWNRSEAARRSRLLEFHQDRLDLRVKVDRVFAEFAAETGLLVAAKRRDRIEVVVAVDPDRARLQRAGDLMSAADVARPDRCGKPVFGVVALENRIVLVGEGDRSADGAKNLLARNLHVVLDVGEQRRIDEVALAGSRGTTGRHGGAFFSADFEESFDAIELLLRYQRSNGALLIEGIAHRDALAKIRELADYFVVAFALHENARAGAADLARIEEHAHHRGRHGLIQVGVREDDIRRFAAEFQRYLFQIAGGGLKDDLADFGRAGERDLIDVGMLGDRATGARAHAGDDIEDAIGNSGSADQRAEPERRQRSLLRGLQDDRVAAGQCRTELPCGHQQREV